MLENLQKILEFIGISTKIIKSITLIFLGITISIPIYLNINYISKASKEIDKLNTEIKILQKENYKLKIKQDFLIEFFVDIKLDSIQ